jgi:hypothetical protein
MTPPLVGGVFSFGDNDMKLPILFQRDCIGDTLLVAPKNKDTLSRLKTLARDHSFTVGAYDEVIIVDQGDGGWDKVSKKAKSFVPQGLHVEQSVTMTHGPETLDYICNHCPRDHKECGGPLATISHYKSGRQKRTVFDSMREAVVRQGDCPIYDVDEKVVDGSIEQRHLRVLGWEPVSSVRAFVHNDEVDEDDYRALVELKAKVPDLGDFAAVKEHGNSAFIDGWLSFGRFQRPRWGQSGSTSIGDLVFDPTIVATNRMVYQIKGGAAQASKNVLNDYRRANCDNCVFECPRPPWDRSNPRPLTEERIMDEFKPDAEAREWMAVFTVLGTQAKFRSESSGRRRVAIGRRPTMVDGKWGVQIASCNPGYETIAELSVEDYLAEVNEQRSYTVDPPSLAEDDEKKLAYAHWALRGLDALTSYNGARFYGNGRHQRNDILSIEMRRSCDYIEIGSDTKATSYGGMGWRGSHITADSRPRFSTGYHYPFADSIWEWFLETPDACRGSKQ